MKCFTALLSRIFKSFNQLQYVLHKLVMLLKKNALFADHKLKLTMELYTKQKNNYTYYEEDE